MPSNEQKTPYYRINYTKAADKFFIKHEKLRNKYEDNLFRIITGEDTAGIDIKRIKGKTADYYRMRIGGYRIIYTIIKGSIVVICTITAGSRGDVYKGSKLKKCLEYTNII